MIPFFGDLQWIVRGAKRQAGALKLCLSLALLRRRLESVKDPSKMVKHVFGLTMRYTDPIVFYYQILEIFVNHQYYFPCDSDAPSIVDCGSNIGMSILYFKRLYPNARILAFESDPDICEILRENVCRNGVSDVKIIEAALSSTSGRSEFLSDGKDGGHLAKYGRHPGTGPIIASRQVQCIRLYDYLNEPVDLLKLDIEGAEYDVLRDIARKLYLVKRMVIDYHTYIEYKPTLHRILKLINNSGFRYLIGHGTARNATEHWKINPGVMNFVLIYAERENVKRGEH